MSGYKRATITISRSEYDQLREAQNRFREVPAVPQPQQIIIREQSNTALLENLHQVTDRQEQLQAVMGRMQAAYSRQEAAMTEKMVRFEAGVIARTEQYAGSLWDHLNDIISQQNDFFAQAMQELQARNQAEFERISAEFQQFAQDTRKKREFAEQTLEAASQLAMFIHNNYPHERFAPRALEAIFRQLQQANLNLTQGLFETAIAGAQQCNFQLSDLRVELERQITEWQTLVLTAWETTTQILTHAGESEYVQAYDLEGSPLPYEVAVNYWSEGKLTQFIQKMRVFIDALESPDLSAERDLLLQWIGHDLPGFYQELADIVEEARINALNSQLRINIADLVVRSLTTQGFALSRSAYEGADERMAYQVRMVNLEGNEVIVQVAPFGKEAGENELHIHSLDKAVRTEHELVQRWSEISRSLSRYGLDVGQYVREESGAYTPGVRPSQRRQNHQRASHPRNVEQSNGR